MVQKAVMSNHILVLIEQLIYSSSSSLIICNNVVINWLQGEILGSLQQMMH